MAPPVRGSSRQRVISSHACIHLLRCAGADVGGRNGCLHCYLVHCTICPHGVHACILDCPLQLLMPLPPHLFQFPSHLAGYRVWRAVLLSF